VHFFLAFIVDFQWSNRLGERFQPAARSNRATGMPGNGGTTLSGVFPAIHLEKPLDKVITSGLALAQLIKDSVCERAACYGDSIIPRIPLVLSHQGAGHFVFASSPVIDPGCSCLLGSNVQYAPAPAIQRQTTSFSAGKLMTAARNGAG
jgi:hypothetical protein